MLSLGDMRTSLGLSEESVTNEMVHKEFCNNFFYANVCQFCIQLSKEKIVKRCSNCDCIFYCSRDHQLSHREEHKDFCNALKFIKTNLDKQDIFQNMPMIDASFKNYLIDLAEIQLNRPLKNCEKQSFLFPRVCLICNESNPKLVKSCKNCPHANFCVKHLDDLDHQRECRFFTFCFYLDHFSLLFKTIPFDDFISVFPRNTKYTPLSTNMGMFLVDYVKPYHKDLYFDAVEVQMHLSSIFYRVVTVIYAIQRLNLTRCTQLQIHVICKKRMDEMNQNEWEILFHWFPKLKSIKIVLIGCQGLPRHVPTKLCDLCKGIKRTLKVEAHYVLYKDYYNETLKVPDIIVAFDVGYMTFRTWMESSSIITYMNTPIVLTGMTQADLLAGLQDCVEDPNKFSQIIINPFGSLRPQRSSRSVVYPSHYISIYGDDSPKIADILTSDDVFDENKTANDNKTKAELIAELKIKNSQLEQKFEIFTSEIHKLKYRNDQLLNFLGEVQELNNKFFNLEDRFYETFETK
ncbi:uncharacterized protein LOC127279446 [Leptopilina boulardi]|uniref:uncharacterized protein LOC127279446 n=1 Tax=Leptopilina boulardi TaxID=63433 RepID=UPI0021F68C81|nr:uncharacterized protein LOC127279446 [Leptopilina boulardi]